jgi:hypothetical protein
MAVCRHCGDEIEEAFRFCPWCSAPLRIKVTEFFPGRAGDVDDVPRALRVSRYFGDDDRAPHVRFSVWSDAERGGLRVESAVSLDEAEAERLSRFLAEVPCSDEAPTL